MALSYDDSTIHIVFIVIIIVIIVLDRGPNPSVERGDLGVRTPVCNDAAYHQITMAVVGNYD